MAVATPGYVPPTTKPSSTGIWIGSLLMIGGIIGGIVLIVFGARDAVSAFTDIEELPASELGTVVDLDEGPYVIYTDSSLGFRGTVTVVEETTGTPIQVRGLAFEQEVTSGSDTWYGQLEFDVAQDGLVRITTPTEESFTDFAVGPELGFDDVGLILLGVGVGAIGFIVGLVILILALVKRGKHKSQQIQGGYQQPYGGQPGSPYGAVPSHPQANQYPPTNPYQPSSQYPPAAPQQPPAGPPPQGHEHYPPPPPR